MLAFLDYLQLCVSLQQYHCIAGGHVHASHLVYRDSSDPDPDLDPGCDVVYPDQESVPSNVFVPGNAPSARLMAYSCPHPSYLPYDQPTDLACYAHIGYLWIAVGETLAFQYVKSQLNCTAPTS